MTSRGSIHLYLYPQAFDADIVLLESANNDLPEDTPAFREQALNPNPNLTLTLTLTLTHTLRPVLTPTLTLTLTLTRRWL